MPFCPKCRYEYLDEVKQCPDCEAPLVDKLPVENPEYTDERVELVEVFHGETHTALILQELLEARGIASILRAREPLSAVLGDRAVPPYSALMVADHDAQKHREIIDECLAFIAEDPQEELPEEDE